MKEYRRIEQFDPPASGVVLTIGNFDGVHLGHRRLIAAVREAGREFDAPVVAVTFEPHPLAVVAPQRAPARLTTCQEKLELLEALGVDAAIVLTSTRELLEQTAERFLTDLVGYCRPRMIVEGPSFNFGRGRAGSVDTLRQYAEKLGFGVRVVDELHSDGLPHHPAINSSAIRRALTQGNINDANAMLGRPYRIVGVVGGDQQRGAVLGFPTANLAEVAHLLPMDAVYVCVAQLADDSLHLAAVNIGPQPTFGQGESRVEAHILDYTGVLRGQRLGLHLLSRLREQVGFASSSDLVTQLHRDVEQTRTFRRKLDELRSTPRLPL